jgi:hypothetical protein
MPWFLCGWLTGVLVLSLRLLLTWTRIQQLRRAGTAAPNAELFALHARLVAHLRVIRPVQLLLSTLVEVPTVIGWLSPVILLPAGAILGLTPIQLEALLAHELAHVRRWDDLVNLFQIVVETLLFYHPAVWWLSARIRQERENCCDDLAARACGDSLTYAEALLRMEELRVPAGNLALAARGGRLLLRVRRLLGATDRDRLFPLWQSGAIALVALTGMTAGLWSITRGATAHEPIHSPGISDAAPLESDLAAVAQPDPSIEGRSSAENEGSSDQRNAAPLESELSDDNSAPADEQSRPVAGLSAKQVIGAIDKAKRSLLKAQMRDGSWKARGSNEHFAVGVTSLAMLALLNAGMSAADPEIQRGLDWLRQQDPTVTYEISLMIQTLAAAKDGRRDIPKIASLVHELEESQIDHGPNAGSWSYSTKLRHLGSGDRSNCQFAVLGLREAQMMGVRVGLDTWRRARNHWLSSQNADGGWSYSAGSNPRGGTGSMTVAGIAALVMTQSMLRAAEEKLDARGAPICCSAPEPVNPLDDACKWLGNNFAVINNPGDGRWLLYYLYGLERAGRFSGKRYFVDSRGQKHDWYREGAEYLVMTQDARSGTWQEGQADPIVGTSFALMFLSKGLAPVLINKLQYGPRDRDGNAIVGGDWNRHPDDVRNLTQYISSRPKWPKQLTWQTVDITHATLADLMQAPILFFNGSEAPQFTPPEAALLKEYVGEGGFLFADNCCQSQAFDNGFRDLIHQMYPPAEADLKKLAAEHPVFRSEFNLLDARTGEATAELWGVDVGGRTGIIYSPGNVSCLWDIWTPFEVAGRPRDVTSMVDTAIRVGVNIAAFVTERAPRNKLDSRK